MPEIDWLPFLKIYSSKLLADADIHSRAPQEVLDAQWLGFPGVTPAEVEAAEARLGQRLPPSYRSFLLATNGWRQSGYFIHKLWPVQEIAWFRERNRRWIDASLRRFRKLPPLSDEEYLVYGEGQESNRFRPAYLETALEISEAGDAAVYLLNPEVQDAQGEWEAWFFADWLPGANRYRSFWDLMLSERVRFSGA